MPPGAGGGPRAPGRQRLKLSLDRSWAELNTTAHGLSLVGCFAALVTALRHLLIYELVFSLWSGRSYNETRSGCEVVGEAK